VKPIKVIVCDDQEIVRQGLSTILNADPIIEVIATATDGEDLLGKIDQCTPDLILMDLKMPIMDGVQATRQIRQRYTEIKVLVLTTYDDEEWVLAAIHAGANGYLLKDTPSEKLRTAIVDTITGKMHLDPTVAGKVVQNLSATNYPVQKADFSLTDREEEILGLMAQGLSNSDIARTLFLSEGTVRNYTSHLFTKLGVNDRTQAVIAALRYGLVDFNDL
jgi:DNA-binding NarL/FixJ family response regulator